jgi:hypothetical protein
MLFIASNIFMLFYLKKRGILGGVISLFNFSWYIGYAVATKKEYGKTGIWFKLSLFCIILFIIISYFEFGMCE